MVSRAEFNSLTARVRTIEQHLHLIDTTPVYTDDEITVIYEGSLDNNSFDYIPDVTFKDENDLHLHVWIHVHGLQNTQSRFISAVSDHKGFYKYFYIRPYYNVLIIQRRTVPYDPSKETPILNTVNTTNVRHPFGSNVCLYFGYSNKNEELPVKNMFSTDEGKAKGVFFIINDQQTNNIVSKYVTAHTGITVFKRGLSDGKVDIYYCSSKVHFKIIKEDTVSKPTSKSKIDESKIDVLDMLDR